MNVPFRLLLFILILVEWSVFGVVFATAPWWSGLNGPWSAIWESLAVDPPKMTQMVASAWNLLIAGYPTVTAATSLGIAVACFWAMRVEARAFGAIWWFRLVLAAVPLIGLAVVFSSLYILPRQQLAQLLNLPRLPRYEDFPNYQKTATDNSRTMEERRQALYSLHTMRVLEQGGVSPPAQRGRNSATVSADALLTVCRQEEAPTELRLFAAEILYSQYIEAQRTDVWRLPIEKEVARRCVFEVYVDVVREGGPAEYAHWQNSGYRSGEWASSAFADTQPPESIVDELEQCLADPDSTVRAEAAAALRAIGTAFSGQLDDKE